jgi:hypothetical protein
MTNSDVVGYLSCVLQSVSQQLEDLLDLSPVLALSRLKKHKEAAAAREAAMEAEHKEAAAAREAEHALQVSRLQDDLQRSHVRNQELQQQLEAALAQLQRRQQQ